MFYVERLGMDGQPPERVGVSAADMEDFRASNPGAKEAAPDAPQVLEGEPVFCTPFGFFVRRDQRWVSVSR